MTLGKLEWAVKNTTKCNLSFDHSWVWTRAARHLTQSRQHIQTAGHKSRNWISRKSEEQLPETAMIHRSKCGRFANTKQIRRQDLTNTKQNYEQITPCTHRNQANFYRMAPNYIGTSFATWVSKPTNKKKRCTKHHFCSAAVQSFCLWYSNIISWAHLASRKAPVGQTPNLFTEHFRNHRTRLAR